MSVRLLPALIALALAMGCASTKIETSGTPLAQPLCQADKPAVSTVVYWGPQWRPDQKEPPLREAAALQGIEDFLKRAGCLSVTAVHRLPAGMPLPTDEELVRLAANSTPIPDRLLLIVIRELGPRLVVGIPVIIQGSTEAQIELRVLNPKTGESLASTQTLWQNGGTFVIKGVKTLDRDMSAALNAVLMPDMAAP
jgi:hypothetical protein